MYKQLVFKIHVLCYLYSTYIIYTKINFNNNNYLSNYSTLTSLKKSPINIRIDSFFLFDLIFSDVIEEFILKDLDKAGKEGIRKTMKNLTSSKMERENEKMQQKIQ
jgi:hypothetical protein